MRFVIFNLGGRSSSSVSYPSSPTFAFLRLFFPGRAFERPAGRWDPSFGGGEGGIKGDLERCFGLVLPDGWRSSSDQGRLVDARLAEAEGKSEMALSGGDPVGERCFGTSNSGSGERVGFDRAVDFGFLRVGWSWSAKRRVGVSCESSKRREKERPWEGLTGESSMKESPGESLSSSLLLGVPRRSRENDTDVCGIRRCRFSLIGDGETGSPRNRLRALVTAVEGAGGRFAGTLASSALRGGFENGDFDVEATGSMRDLATDFFCGENGLNASNAAVRCTMGVLASNFEVVSRP